MTPAAAAAPARRLYFLDALRIGAFAWLVLYHVGMYYVTWDFHVKSPFAGPALEPLMRLTEPWRMSLLFLVSGTATGLMLARAAPRTVLRQRLRVLLLPLLLGVAVIVPPQAYAQVVQRHGYGGSYAEFLALYFTAFDGFCDGRRCLVLPTWNHLWYLPYVAAYTLVLVALTAWWPTLPATLGRAMARAARRPLGLLGATAAVMAVLRAGLSGHFPVTHALVDDVHAHAVYLPMFLAGAALAHAPTAWDDLAARRHVALAVALAAWALWVFGGLGPTAAHGLVGLLHAAALLAAIGLARHHLDRDWRGRASLNEAVYPMYLVHQTVIIVASVWLLPLRLPPALEAPLLAAAAFAVGGLTYGVVRRRPWLRPWFGLRRAVAPAADGNGRAGPPPAHG